MRIAFDLDGVLYPWTVASWEYCVRHKFTNQSYEDFFMHTDLKTPLFWDNLIKDPTLYEVFPPTKKMMDFLHKVARKHQIFYITSRPAEVHRVTERFMTKYKFPHVENLKFSTDKDMEIVKYSIAAMVEDMVKHAEACSKHCVTYLVETPYNRIPVSSRVIRINSIYDLEGALL